MLSLKESTILFLHDIHAVTTSCHDVHLSQLEMCYEDDSVLFPSVTSWVADFKNVIIFVFA